MKYTEENLKRVGRKELISIVLQLEEEYENELQIQKDENAKLRTELQDRKIQIDESGSIAEAALKVNGIFEAAQNAAKDYLDSIKAQTSETDQICERRNAESEAYAARVKEEADTVLRENTEKSDRIVREAREFAEKSLREAQSKADSITEEAKTQAESLLSRSKSEADMTILSAQEKSDAMVREASERSLQMETEAKNKSEEYWKNASAKINQLIDEHQELAALLRGISIPGKE